MKSLSSPIANPAAPSLPFIGPTKQIEDLKVFKHQMPFNENKKLISSMQSTTLEGSNSFRNSTISPPTTTILRKHFVSCVTIRDTINNNVFTINASLAYAGKLGTRPSIVPTTADQNPHPLNHKILSTVLWEFWRKTCPPPLVLQGNPPPVIPYKQSKNCVWQILRWYLPLCWKEKANKRKNSLRNSLEKFLKTLFSTTMTPSPISPENPMENFDFFSGNLRL